MKRKNRTAVNKRLSELDATKRIIAANKEKIILKSNLAPGDTVMMAYAVKALGEQYGNRYEIGVDATAAGHIFEANPYLAQWTETQAKKARIVDIGYPTIHRSSQASHHFAQGYVQDTADKLGIKLNQPEWNPAIWLSDDEKHWIRQVDGDKPYWIINAGWKNDFTTKAWVSDYWQRLVDLLPDTNFVQVGSTEHNHPPIKAKNVTNLIGQTDTRQLIRMVYHAAGVITPVSFLFHLGYAVEWKNKPRGIICIAGGRESAGWQIPPLGQYLHTVGQLPCCQLGGCWKSRTVPLADGDDKDKSLCDHPVHLEKQVAPLCQTLISPELVANHVFLYEQGATL